MKTEEDVRVGVQHPLDPLTAAEIEAASSILKRDRGLAGTARFVYVTLKEPSKDAVLSYRSGEVFGREAHIVLRERAERRTYEAVVSITAGEVRLWREVPGVQPAVMLEEFLATEAAVKKDARWQEAMRRRGVTDFDNVMIDPWSVGYNGPQDATPVALPSGPENPYGNAWVVRQTPLRRESQAQRVADGRAARYWKITNPGKPNATGEPVAYKLVPQDSVLPFCQPDTRAIRRAQFATKHLWVTAYDPEQRFPAGEYPNQHPGGDGLPAWTAADRPLENADLVLWHTFTAHHVVRPEDWPVMPVTCVGFQLRADGFFDGNPALDVPPDEHCHRHA